MYVTSGPAVVVALDLKPAGHSGNGARPIATGRAQPRISARQPRRGDLLDDTVYVGTLDGYLVALDAKSGDRAVDRAGRRQHHWSCHYRGAAGVKTR